MSPAPFTLASFPRAILHIDGDAFFASCEQSRDPKLRGKPVATGGERGQLPTRKANSLKGESKRRRLALPMFLGEVK